MANTNAPNGFQVFARLDGGAPTAGFEYFTIASNNTNAIGYGDPVIRLSTGYIDIATAAAAVAWLGIFYGCQYYSTGVSRMVYSPNWPGSGNSGTVQAIVCTDSDTKFVAQSYSTAIVFADIGNGIDVKIGTPQSSGGGFSTSSADQSTMGATTTLPMRVSDLLSTFESGTNGTDDTTSYNRVILQPNFWDRKSLVGI